MLASIESTVTASSAPVDGRRSSSACEALNGRDDQACASVTGSLAGSFADQTSDHLNDLTTSPENRPNEFPDKSTSHRMTSAERFWARVAKGDGCWEWKGPVTSRGYGWIQVDKRQWSTHRLSWTLTFGPIVDGRFVCHRCDNRRCVRPDHLFLGTHADNMADMAAKGRAAGGQRKKLTETQVRDIRASLATGERPVTLARHYGVTRQCIYVIALGITWPSVGGT